MSEHSGDWQPLSVRKGLRSGDLYPGLPKHLRAPIRYWLEGVFGFRTAPKRGMSGMRPTLILAVAARTGVALTQTRVATDMMHELINAGEQNEQLLLDIVDAVLDSSPGAGAALARILLDGRSIWTVSADRLSLQLRVDITAQAAFDRASTPTDLASEELNQAWGRLFGREPDPSDAWDHAIKAVEALSIPLVVPKQAKAQLGHVLGALSESPPRFTLQLGAQESLATLVSMLRLLWPNPDRHATEGTSRTPTDREAQAVVHLAVTIVQWLRQGLLQQL